MSSTNLSQRSWVWGSAKGFDLKLFHKQVGNERADGGTHGSTMYLFIILSLEEEVCVLRQNSSNGIMCKMDMLVLLGKEWSCCHFCLAMLMEGSLIFSLRPDDAASVWRQQKLVFNKLI